MRNDDKMFPFTKEVIEEMTETMIRQDEKGMGKYQRPLTPADGYDWLTMVSEELVDGMKYLHCERVQRDLRDAAILQALSDLERIRSTYSAGNDGLYYALRGVDLKIRAALYRPNDGEPNIL